MSATPKQQAYIHVLLKKTGRTKRFLNSSYKAFATCHERSMTVDAWLEYITPAKASKVIDSLKAEAGE